MALAICASAVTAVTAGTVSGAGVAANLLGGIGGACSSGWSSAGCSASSAAA